MKVEKSGEQVKIGDLRPFPPQKFEKMMLIFWPCLCKSVGGGELPP